MDDHLVPQEAFITNLYLTKCCPYLYFLSNAKAITEQGALFSVRFYDFTTFAQNIRGLVFVGGVLTAKP